MSQVLQDFMFLMSGFVAVAAFFSKKCFLGQHTPLDPIMFKAKFL